LRRKKEAVALEPDYESFYFLRANWLQPKWYGQDGEWLRFAEQAAERTKAAYGQEYYARIVWATFGTTNDQPLDGVNWARMRTGFEDMMKRHPESLWNLNAFAYFAVRAKDQPTALKLFGELKGRFAPAIWGTSKKFEAAEIWARTNEAR
jgi:hypothetical protein